MSSVEVIGSSALDAILEEVRRGKIDREKMGSFVALLHSSLSKKYEQIKSSDTALMRTVLSDWFKHSTMCKQEALQKLINVCKHPSIRLLPLAKVLRKNLPFPPSSPGPIITTAQTRF